jgi:mono/diheme cytochrome c family protein
MSRPRAAALVLVAAFLAAGPALATAPKIAGDVKTGKTLFKAQGCNSCHMLAVAGFISDSGTGPDLDHTRKTYARIVNQITKGGPGMTPYKGVLTTAQIQDLAAFVYTSAHPK